MEARFSQSDLVELFNWLDGYCPHWQFPKLFLTVKAYTASRLADRCGLRADQVQEVVEQFGGVRFDADQVKGRKERTVPLPLDMAEALTGFAGKKYLWERYVGQLRDVLKKKGVPTHRLNPEFSPTRLYQWVENLFKEYNATKPKSGPLTSHQFRKRAFTLAHKGGIRPHDAAIAFGCNVDTLMRHYVALDEQEVTDDVFKRIGANILGAGAVPQLFHKSPETAPGTPTEKCRSEFKNKPYILVLFRLSDIF